MHKKFILASSSKSRYKMLKNCGFKFTQKEPTCDEENIKKTLLNKKPADFVKNLSYQKAISINKTDKFFNYFIIGCDTVIYLDNVRFDKAKDMKEAAKKIRSLSGKTHRIVSGVTICNKGKKIWQCTETTKVKMRKLTNQQINKYLTNAGIDILSSVGCYQIELLGPNIIEDIKGDYFNVLGLPLFKLLKYVNQK